MNSPERLNSLEHIKTNEAALLDIRDGLMSIEKLAGQKANGADVANALEEAREAIFQRLARAIDDVEQKGVTKVIEPELGSITQDQTPTRQDDFGGMDPERFEQTDWDKFSKGI